MKDSDGFNFIAESNKFTEFERSVASLLRTALEHGCAVHGIYISCRQFEVILDGCQPENLAAKLCCCVSFAKSGGIFSVMLRRRRQNGFYRNNLNLCVSPDDETAFHTQLKNILLIKNAGKSLSSGSSMRLRRYFVKDRYLGSFLDWTGTLMSACRNPAVSMRITRRADGFLVTVKRIASVNMPDNPSSVFKTVSLFCDDFRKTEKERLLAVSEA